MFVDRHHCFPIRGVPPVRCTDNSLFTAMTCIASSMSASWSGLVVVGGAPTRCSTSGRKKSRLRPAPLRAPPCVVGRGSIMPTTVADANAPYFWPITSCPPR